MSTKIYSIGSKFGRDGMNWEVVRRTGDIAMIQAVGGGHWEVVRIRRHKSDRTIKGVLAFKANSEFLPSDEDFGTHGFAFNEIGHATAKYHGMVIDEQRKASDHAMKGGRM
jgi:hypothetical protein